MRWLRLKKVWHITTRNWNNENTTRFLTLNSLADSSFLSVPHSLHSHSTLYNESSTRLPLPLLFLPLRSCFYGCPTAVDVFSHRGRSNTHTSLKVSYFYNLETTQDIWPTEKNFVGKSDNWTTLKKHIKPRPVWSLSSFFIDIWINK